MSIVPDSYNASRKQYHSTAVLRKMIRYQQRNIGILPGIIDVDLYASKLNYVFGG